MAPSEEEDIISDPEVLSEEEDMISDPKEYLLSSPEEADLVPPEEQKHIEAVQNAMENKGILDHAIVHGVFVGLAHSGKDSLMKRLLGKKLSNISPSTGVAENTVQVKVMKKSSTIAANIEQS